MAGGITEDDVLHFSLLTHILSGLAKWSYNATYMKRADSPPQSLQLLETNNFF